MDSLESLNVASLEPGNVLSNTSLSRCRLPRNRGHALSYKAVVSCFHSTNGRYIDLIDLIESNRCFTRRLAPWEVGISSSLEICMTRPMILIDALRLFPGPVEIVF